MSKYVFYLETKGKTIDKQCLFVDLAVYLANNTDNDVYYVNNFWQDDFDRQVDSKLNFCDLRTCDFSQFEGATFFTPVNYLLFLLDRTKSLNDAKICLYNYEHDALKWLMHHIDCDEKYRIELIDMLTHNNCWALVDNKCPYATPFSTYIPMALTHSMKEYTPIEVFDKQKINIALLCPVSGKTLYTITNLLNTINLSNLKTEIDVHLIGDIKLELQDVNTALSDFTLKCFPNNQMRLIVLGNLSDDKKAEYLKQNVDLVIADKRNALEAAAAGLPTVIPVSDQEPFVGNNFVYLFDTNGYIFNWNNEELLSYGYESHTIKYILNAIYNKNEKIALAQQCYNFSKDNCSLEHISEVFIKLAEKTTLTLQKARQSKAISYRFAEFNKYLTRHKVTFLCLIILFRLMRLTTKYSVIL